MPGWFESAPRRANTFAGSKEIHAPHQHALEPAVPAPDKPSHPTPRDWRRRCRFLQAWQEPWVRQPLRRPLLRSGTVPTCSPGALVAPVSEGSVKPASEADLRSPVRSRGTAASKSCLPQFDGRFPNPSEASCSETWSSRAASLTHACLLLTGVRLTALRKHAQVYPTVASKAISLPRSQFACSPRGCGRSRRITGWRWRIALLATLVAEEVAERKTLHREIEMHARSRGAVLLRSFRRCVELIG